MVRFISGYRTHQKNGGYCRMTLRVIRWCLDRAVFITHISILLTYHSLLITHLVTHHSKLGVCTIQSARFFSKFIIELIRIGFLIIETDAHRLGLVFRPIAVRFLVAGLFGLVGLIFFNSIERQKHKKKKM